VATVAVCRFTSISNVILGVERFMRSSLFPRVGEEFAVVGDLDAGAKSGGSAVYRGRVHNEISIVAARRVS
jgi:hypothetical protein